MEKLQTTDSYLAHTGGTDYTSSRYTRFTAADRQGRAAQVEKKNFHGLG